MLEIFDVFFFNIFRTGFFLVESGVTIHRAKALKASVKEFTVFVVTNINSFMTGSLSYKNQFIDFLCKSTDWFLCDRDLLYERVNKF